jgi:hypothetical protein
VLTYHTYLNYIAYEQSYFFRSHRQQIYVHTVDGLAIGTEHDRFTPLLYLITTHNYNFYTNSSHDKCTKQKYNSNSCYHISPLKFRIINL